MKRCFLWLRRSSKIFFWLICASSILEYLPLAAHAGFGLNPSFLQLSIPVGQLSAAGVMTVTNHEEVAQVVRVVPAAALPTTSGDIQVDPTVFTPDAPPTPNWVKISPAQFTLNAGGTQTIQVIIPDSESLPAGTSTVAVVVSPASLAGAGSEVQVQTRLVGYVLVTREEGAVRSLAANSARYEPQKLWEQPRDVWVGMRNTGSVLTVPRGRVLLLSPKGAILAQGVLNDESAFLLPDRERLFRTHLETQLKQPWYEQYGRYRLLIQYREQSGEQPQFSELYFYYVHPLILGVVVVNPVLWVLFWRRRKHLVKRVARAVRVLFHGVA